MKGKLLKAYYWILKVFGKADNVHNCFLDEVFRNYPYIKMKL